MGEITTSNRNWLQIASFHYGFSTDLNTIDLNKVTRDRFGGIVGASVGWNFFVDNHFYLKPSIDIPFTYEDVGIVVRIKYMDTYAPTHSVGGVLYIHY